MKNLTLKDRIALTITGWVGTLECALLFTILALISLPTALHGGVGTTISWIAQTFLQLVLLSVIMVGQSIQASQADEISEKHYKTLLRHEEKIDTLLKSQEKYTPLRDHIFLKKDGFVKIMGDSEIYNILYLKSVDKLLDNKKQ